MINMPVELTNFEIADLRQRAEINGDVLAAWAADEIDRLTRERDTYLAERQQMRDALPACMEENGPTLLEAIERMCRELEEAKAVLAQIRQSFLDYAAEKARKPCP